MSDHTANDGPVDLHRRSRALRNVTEPIAAGVYFAPEAINGYEELGLDYFEGYFCSRSACLGRAPWSVVAAAFAAFKPQAVQAAVTGGWAKTDPTAMLAAREAGATAQLARLISDADPAAVARATEILFAATDGVDPSGRVLFAGLSVLDRPTTPLGALWRATDLVREHRGDGHIASWIPYVDSTEITVMTELAWEIPPRTYVFTRGWNEADVDGAYARLEARGLVADGALTLDGTILREQIEAATDESTRDVMARIGDDFDELIGLLRPWAEAIVAGGGYPASPKNLRVDG
ncbi:MAG: SCO6745 family protein [Acidimicrobiia bacterium]